MKMDLNLLSHESQPLSINIAIFLHSTNLNKNSKNRAFFFHGAVWKGFVWVASFWSLVVSQTQSQTKTNLRKIRVHRYSLSDRTGSNTAWIHHDRVCWLARKRSSNPAIDKAYLSECHLPVRSELVSVYAHSHLRRFNMVGSPPWLFPLLHPLALGNDNLRMTQFSTRILTKWSFTTTSPNHCWQVSSMGTTQRWVPSSSSCLWIEISAD